MPCGSRRSLSPDARTLDIGETTARRYIDGLRDALLIRLLPPWRDNQRKRLVRSPKIYYRDSGVLHALWGVADREALLRHSGVGVSWESLVLEEILRRAPGQPPYFWRTSNGAELDLLLGGSGRRVGFEMKRADAPKLTASIRRFTSHALELSRWRMPFAALCASNRLAHPGFG